MALSAVILGIVLIVRIPNVPRWNYYLKLSWRGEGYMITRSYITEPGKKLGTVRYLGHGAEYDLYLVNGASEKKAICIKTGNGYLLALGVTTQVPML